MSGIAQPGSSCGSEKPTRAQPRTILFVNRWKGVIGPNVWLGQVASEALRRGHRVHVASPWLDEWTDGLAVRGVDVHIVEGLSWVPRGLNPLRHIAHAAGSRRAIGRLVDIVHWTGARVLCVNGLNMPYVPQAGGRAGCPVVMVMHGARLPRSRWARRLFFAIQQPFVTRYVVVAEASRLLLVENGVRPEKVLVLPNGIDTALYAPRPPEESLAGELGLDATRPIIGAITHLTSRKGVHHLVEAVGRLVQHRPDLQCLIVGTTTDEEDEQYAERLRARIAELGLAGSVFLAGYRTDVPDVLSLLDLLVHPSETEACPYSVMQAQACGRAVVGFRVGGMPEVVDDGRTGILVQPFDVDALAKEILGLLEHPERRAMLGAAARQRAIERFDGARNVGKVVEFLADPEGFADREPIP